RRPHRLRIEPDGECLGEVFVRVALRVPVIEVLDEALAVRLRRVVLRIFLPGIAEQTPPCRTPTQSIGVVDRVADFVPQDPETYVAVAAFDFEHLRELELREPWMREVERN